MNSFVAALCLVLFVFIGVEGIDADEEESVEEDALSNWTFIIS